MKHLCKISCLFLLNLLTVNLFADNGDTNKIKLYDLSIEELIEQRVTIATKTEEKNIKSPSVVSVITAEEIRIMGYRELQEVLQSIAGVEFFQNRIGAKGYGIRGVSDNRQGGRLLVLLDGISYNSVMYGTGIYFGAEFNMDIIERIEIIRGPGSALYGRNAFSIVINIITKKADNTAADLGMSLGSFNTYDIHGAYQFKKNDVSALISAKYYTTDGTDATFDNGMGGESQWNLTHDNLYLNGNAKYKNFSFFGSYSYRLDGSTAPIMFLTQSKSIFNIATYNINYEGRISSNTNFTIKLFGRNEKRIQDIEYLKPGITEIIPNTTIPYGAVYREGLYAEPEFDDYTYGGEFEFSLVPFRKNHLLLGALIDLHGINNATVKTNYDLMSPDFRPLTYVDENDSIRYYSKDNMPLYQPGWIINGGHDYRNFALYFQDRHSILSNLNLTMGGRFDFDSEAGFIFNPRAGLVWEPVKWGYIKLLYGEAYRAPTTNEQYKLMGFDKGNENLKYEEIRTTELVIGAFTSNFLSQISLFYNKLNNGILQQNIDAQVKSYYNLGENNSYGFEIENKFFISKSLSTFFNLGYNESEDKDYRNNSVVIYEHPNVSRYKVNFGFVAKFSKNISFSTGMLYHGPFVKFKDPVSGTEWDVVNKVGDYYLLNSALTIDNVIKNLNLAIYGYNLLNAEYYFQDDQNLSQPPQPGIHFLIRASYNLNFSKE